MGSATAPTGTGVCALPVGCRTVGALHACTRQVRDQLKKVHVIKMEGSLASPPACLTAGRGLHAEPERQRSQRRGRRRRRRPCNRRRLHALDGHMSALLRSCGADCTRACAVLRTETSRLSIFKSAQRSAGSVDAQSSCCPPLSLPHGGAAPPMPTRRLHLQHCTAGNMPTRAPVIRLGSCLQLLSIPPLRPARRLSAAPTTHSLCGTLRPPAASVARRWCRCTQLARQPHHNSEAQLVRLCLVAGRSRSAAELDGALA